MKQSCQDAFLNSLRKNKISVTIFLSNGIKLQGIITGFDSFAILLRRDSHIQLIYKHTVSTVMPNGHFTFRLDDEDITVEPSSVPINLNKEEKTQK
jgi:host factor-I protein